MRGGDLVRRVPLHQVAGAGDHVAPPHGSATPTGSRLVLVAPQHQLRAGDAVQSLAEPAVAERPDAGWRRRCRRGTRRPVPPPRRSGRSGRRPARARPWRTGARMRSGRGQAYRSKPGSFSSMIPNGASSASAVDDLGAQHGQLGGDHPADRCADDVDRAVGSGAGGVDRVPEHDRASRGSRRAA